MFFAACVEAKDVHIEEEEEEEEEEACVSPRLLLFMMICLNVFVVHILPFLRE